MIIYVTIRINKVDLHSHQYYIKCVTDDYHSSSKYHTTLPLYNLILVLTFDGIYDLKDDLRALLFRNPNNWLF